MRTLCPNLDREDGLDTVLEVPIPEESFGGGTNGNNSKHGGGGAWQNVISWMRPGGGGERSNGGSDFVDRNAEIQLLLGVIGAPLVPVPVPVQCYEPGSTPRSIKDHPIEASMAKYIVQQYIAATGGEKALNSIDSMYAVGKVKMAAVEFSNGDEMGLGCNALTNGNGQKAAKIKNMKMGAAEMGGFVLWQKRPELWSLELVVSGYKISAGSDGKVAWRQTPWHHSHASRGPPRPLRRSLQGLDPKSTSALFTNSICIGEKTINGEDCFILKIEADPSTLKTRSSSNVDIIKHTLWGYFSQKTGLLFQLKDTHLLRIKSLGSESIFWETTMESLIQDYRNVDGVNIAHGGRTSVSLFRFGDNSEGHSQTKMEEVWEIEEVDFNIKGLSIDCFLPPSDLKKEEEKAFGVASGQKLKRNGSLGSKIRSGSSSRIGVSKVVAIDANDLENMGRGDVDL